MLRDVFAIATIVTGAWWMAKGNKNIGKAFVFGVYLGNKYKFV